jgi:hypothetical protein
MKANTSTKDYMFRSHQAHSPEEILAAGGADAFGKKSGKNNATLIKALEESDPIEPFTEQEWEDLKKQLENDK